MSSDDKYGPYPFGDKAKAALLRLDSSEATGEWTSSKQFVRVLNRTADDLASLSLEGDEHAKRQRIIDEIEVALGNDPRSAGNAPPDPYSECLNCGTWHYTRNQRKCSSPNGHRFASQRSAEAPTTIGWVAPTDARIDQIAAGLDPAASVSVDEARAMALEIRKARAQRRERATPPAQDAKDHDAAVYGHGFYDGRGAAAAFVEVHSCVATCCDAQPSGSDAKALADCIRRNVKPKEGA